MLSFVAEFPVDSSSTLDGFLRSVQKWVVSSPHTEFEEEQLSSALNEIEYSIATGHQQIKGLRASRDADEIAAVRHSSKDKTLEWTTTIVFRKIGSNSWVSVRTQVESPLTLSVLPPAKKPIIVRDILGQLGGGLDGILRVQNKPHLLGNSDIERAASLIVGTAGCYLPVVYVSANFSGEYTLDVHKLSNALAGMAHVVVEPNRPFSRRLQIEVSSTNVYGGTVGIYWPEASGRRAFFLGHQFDGADEIETAIQNDIRTALLNRRPLHICSWSAAEEAVSQNKIESLKNSDSAKLEDFIAAFDKETDSLRQQLEEAEQEISRLKAQARALENANPITGTIGFKLGTEQDFFSGEIHSVLFDAIVLASDNVQEDSRRHHIIKSVIAANSKTSNSEEYKNKIKSLLRNYKHMTAEIRASLQKMGFDITEEGKHYKLIYKGDDRYTFALSKSGSDFRGGLNAASDISKRLF